MSAIRGRLGSMGPLVVSLCVACGGAGAKPAESAPGASSVPARDVATYAFESLDARPVTSTAFAGKPVVLAFVTTWDLPSQAQVRYLIEMDKRDQGKVAYAAVCLQESKDRELIEVYRSTLGVTFPMAIADRGTLAGAGAFGDVQSVPTVVVVDATGHVVLQKVGLVPSDEIRAALRGL